MLMHELNDVEIFLRRLKDLKIMPYKAVLSLQSDDKRTMETLYLK
jgi:hypothetical protein|tara:strand:- start:440 stop:574 length:135 start_codon:yes stop_codon:yes gene_type:complete